MDSEPPTEIVPVLPAAAIDNISEERLSRDLKVVVLTVIGMV